MEKQWKDLDVPVHMHILKFVGLKQSLTCIALVDKSLRDVVKQALVLGSKGVDAKLDTANDELEGQTLNGWLEQLRFRVFEAGLGSVSKKAEEILKSPADLYLMRHSGMLNDMLILNSAMYTYWDTTPDIPDQGIIHMMDQYVKSEKFFTEPTTVMSAYLKEAFYRDVIHFKDDRVCGEFIILFETQGGAILVNNETNKVYRVLGIRDSIGRLLGSTNTYALHSNVIGYSLFTTILPWNGNIVYDGLLGTAQHKVSPKKLKESLCAYMQAVDSGELITTLPRRCDSSSSSLDRRSSLLAAKYMKNTDPSVDHLRITLSLELKRIKKFPVATGEEMWVLRRHGYTEADNPYHLVTVVSANIRTGPILVGQPLAALTPTVEECVRLLMITCEAFYGRKPFVIGIDAKAIVATFDTVMSGTGIRAVYYPPPSAEEVVVTREHGQWKPSVKPLVDRFPPGAMVCDLCTVGMAPNGGPLLKCARCKKVWYCGKEHQKLHWRVHKALCVLLS